MSLTDQDVAFIHAVADAVDSIVVANCTQGRWRAGSGLSQATASSIRAVGDDGQEYLLGTAIDKANQRAMMASQPELLRVNAKIMRAVDTDTADAVAASLLELAQLYNIAMSLRVDEPATVA